MDPDQAAACPRLVKLRISTNMVEVLQKLPADTLTSLHINDLRFENESHEELEQLVAALSRLTRLWSLFLGCGLQDFIPVHQWTDLHDHALCNLFTNMKKLEVVGITFSQFHAANVDSVIETLGQNCPSVSWIRMMDARMTDAGLRSLSRLKELQNLEIRSFKWLSVITTEGIMSLLRGGSRNVMRDLKLKTSVLPDFFQIRAEVKLMREETGRRLKVEAGTVPSTLGIGHSLKIN